MAGFFVNFLSEVFMNRDTIACTLIFIGIIILIGYSIIWLVSHSIIVAIAIGLILLGGIILSIP